MRRRRSDHEVLIIDDIPKGRGKLDKSYKADAVKAAKDLHYSIGAIARIEAAKTDIEIDRIMRTELRRKYR